VLLDNKDFHYKIIICGKGLPAEMNGLKAYSAKNIIYTGFAPDIIPYFKAADLFLNPVLTGGGIKTKMVEAIAYGATVIAYATGASGIDQQASGQKLVIVPDNDWKEFGNAVIRHANDRIATPPVYYETYYWENVINHLLDQLADHPAAAAKDH
jgi:Glycosyltransferase